MFTSLTDNGLEFSCFLILLPPPFFFSLSLSSFCRFELARYASSLAEVRHGFEDRLQQWVEYENLLERITEWLNESEEILKQFNLKNTLHEKVEQLNKFQVILIKELKNF